MDYGVITNVSKGFKATADALKALGKILAAAIQVLRAAAFFSAGTSLALANYLEVIKKKVQALAKLCTQFSKDLADAVTDHKKGDIRGKRYFGEGI
jgi:hypothetical protein